MREAVAQAALVQGFLMDQRMPKDGKAPPATPEPVFKDIRDVQRFLHQEQGFGRIIR